MKEKISVKIPSKASHCLTSISIDECSARDNVLMITVEELGDSITSTHTIDEVREIISSLSTWIMKRNKIIDLVQSCNHLEYKSYAGIGSRETPSEILTVMSQVASTLGNQNWILRTGAAPGADLAFMKGAYDAQGRMEVGMPWLGTKSKRFCPWLEGKDSDQIVVRVPEREQYCELREVIEKYHPAPHNLSPAAEKFMMRNTWQVLGYDLSVPSKFVICWTPDAKIVGGTGQALRIANGHSIPIFNLADKNTLSDVIAFLEAAE